MGKSETCRETPRLLIENPKPRANMRDFETETNALQMRLRGSSQRLSKLRYRMKSLRDPLRGTIRHPYRFITQTNVM